MQLVGCLKSINEARDIGVGGMSPVAIMLLKLLLFFGFVCLAFCNNNTTVTSNQSKIQKYDKLKNRTSESKKSNCTASKFKGYKFNGSKVMSESGSMRCNGFIELCDLDITQVTLAGSHNSGAGAFGLMKHQTKVAQSLASNCFFRNQQKSFYEQLEMGIRYFDIDACWVDSHSPVGAWVCNKPAYAGPVRVMLEQIDRWMNEPHHRNEVIVIHFTRDSEKKFKDLLASDLTRQLLVLWEPNEEHLANEKLTMATTLNPKLRDAIKSNQRIYMIIHEILILRRQPWMIPHWVVGYTWTHMQFVGSRGCYSLMSDMSGGRCQREAARSFLRYDLYLSSGLCLQDMAKYCRKYIKYGVHKCFQQSWMRRSTVNFIVVDYAGYEVVKAAKCQNFRNIQFFLGEESSEYKSDDFVDCF